MHNGLTGAMLATSIALLSGQVKANPVYVALGDSITFRETNLNTSSRTATAATSAILPTPWPAATAAFTPMS